MNNRRYWAEKYELSLLRVIEYVIANPKCSPSDAAAAGAVGVSVRYGMRTVRSAVRSGLLDARMPGYRVELTIIPASAPSRA